MANGPSKSDIQTIFKRLRSIPTNKICFDCNTKNPTWASVTYGVFLCIDCSATHRSLGVHVTFIRSTQLDTSWTWPQLRAMQVGSNANATAFFRQHGASTNDANAKYHSRAASLYKDKIKTQAAAAMRKYGTELHLEEFVQSPQTKEVDFFEEHVDTPSPTTTTTTTTISNGSLATEFEPMSRPTPTKPDPVEMIDPEQSLAVKDNDTSGAPSVEAALSTSPTQAQAKADARKPTIGQRKAGAKKGKGLGAKKGLGAQKVKTNFDDIETKAHQHDKMREESVKMAEIQKVKNKEDEEARIASMKLAYQDMSLQMKKQEEKLKKEDPKKAEQMERLGMGYSGRAGVSHSAVSDMQTIEQVNPVKPSTRSKPRERDFFDDYDTGFSSRSSSSRAYKEPSSSLWGDDKDDDKPDSSWDIVDKSDTRQSSYDSIAPLESRSKSKHTEYDSGASSGEAMKRFGNAKGISSDQYFNRDKDDYETKTRSAQFANSNSLSSDEFFGRASRSQGSGGNSGDLGAIKDGMKDGVTQVAGKISRMANGVFNSIQDHYGY